MAPGDGNRGNTTFALRAPASIFKIRRGRRRVGGRFYESGRKVQLCALRIRYWPHEIYGAREEIAILPNSGTTLGRWAIVWRLYFSLAARETETEGPFTTQQSNRPAINYLLSIRPANLPFPVSDSTRESLTLVCYLLCPEILSRTIVPTFVQCHAPYVGCCATHTLIARRHKYENLLIVNHLNDLSMDSMF